MASGGRDVAEQMANHCSAAGLLADRLGLSAEVRSGIEQSYARWDGKGVPGELHGDQLSLASRISHVADAAEVLVREGQLSRLLELRRADLAEIQAGIQAKYGTDALPLDLVFHGGSGSTDDEISTAVKNGVSDIHITVGLPPVFRMDGGMRPQATKSRWWRRS